MSGGYLKRQGSSMFNTYCHEGDLLEGNGLGMVAVLLARWRMRELRILMAPLLRYGDMAGAD
jgi:hypothetical protein